MEAKTIRLWSDGAIESSLAYWDVPAGDGARPAVLVVPGGGYGCVCIDTEGWPIAERFSRLGFRAFVLSYRVVPHRYPSAQQDILRAIKLMRSHASEWGVKADQIAVCGFSAGGHLCACAGILYDEISADNGDDADTFSGRPDAMLLAYPVITSGPKGHDGSFKNLLGEEYGPRRGEFSLENRVTESVPPAFIWATAEDEAVPVENSLLFASALREKNIPCDLHIFPHGSHGMQLGYGRVDIGQWPEQAKAFLTDTCGFRIPGEAPYWPRRTVVLTFDDACRSHLANVAPILKEYGFNATFFICRFDEEFQRTKGHFLLTGPEIRQLSDMGFEIGNHTWSHPDLRTLDEDAIRREIVRMNDFLEEAGVPRPVSFAYPGGPYAGNAAPIIREMGFICARTTEFAPWIANVTEPMRVPATPLQGDAPFAFFHTLAFAEKHGQAACLLFHGVPDLAHDHVNTEPEVFRKYMKYLHDHDYRVVSMKQFMTGE